MAKRSIFVHSRPGAARKGSGAMAGGPSSTAATPLCPQPGRRDARPARGKPLKRKAGGTLKGPKASKILVKIESKATPRSRSAASKKAEKLGRDRATVDTDGDDDSEGDNDSDDDAEKGVDAVPKVRPGPKRSALATSTSAKQLVTTKSRPKKSSGYLTALPPPLPSPLPSTRQID
jgi:hypothetical protein